MKSAFLTAAILTLALLPAQLTAQSVDDPEANLSPELVVTGRVAGPAWWKVSGKDSEVWIMGLPPTDTPADLDWEKAPLKRRLKGANALVLPPSGGGQPVAHKGPRRPPPRDLTARFDALRKQLGEPAGKYDANPTFVFAVADLYYDARRKRGVGNVQADIRKLARAQKVRIVQGKLKSPRAVNNTDLPQDTPEVRACVTAMLDDIEAPTEITAPAQAWAEGRLGEALSARRLAIDTCEIRGLWPRESRRRIDHQTAEIEAALKRRGKTVVLVPMRQLLAQDGVIMRLRARGYDVRAPAGGQ